jgi:uncharacterized C2H2 Zn-finger protein
MTLHISYDHQCSGCGAHYIPYDNVPCPRCGLVEAERFDYIPQAVASMQANKRQWGTYMPGAWWAGSLGDHILHLLFHLFDLFELEQAGTSFDQYITGSLANMQWGEQEYLRDHLRGIALRVREELDRAAQVESATHYRPERVVPVGADVDEEPGIPVTPYIPDWVQCPNCGKRFSLRNPYSWSGRVHLTCGQRLEIQEPETGGAGG